MKLLDRILGRTSRRPARGASSRESRFATPRLEALEDRTLLDATGVLAGGVLTITTTPNSISRVQLATDGTNLFLSNDGQPRGTFLSAAVTSIVIDADGLFNTVRLLPGVTQPTTFDGTLGGTNFFYDANAPSTMIGGAGTNRMAGGTGNDALNAGSGVNILSGGLGQNMIFGAGAFHSFFLGQTANDFLDSSDPPPIDFDLRSGLADPPDLSSTLGLPITGDSLPANQLTATQVNGLLARAAAATSYDSGIVVVVDRGGRILGVRVEGGVSPVITSNVDNLVFAIDGAVAEARTGAFFASDQAPLTSRTVQFISQTTITQQMIDSNPSITDPNSTLKGPGTVGPQGIGGHFPPGVMDAPQVDLFGIEDTNRDTTFHPIYDANGDIIRYDELPERFNANPADIPASIQLAGDSLEPPDSYGFESGVEPLAMPRGIGTLPGGLPIYNNNFEVGGIGIFYPGTTGYANEENSALSSTYDPTKQDLSEVAEYAAFAAVGGINAPLDGVAPVSGITPFNTSQVTPTSRIDLVGITLPIFGPGGSDAAQGALKLAQFGATLGTGDATSGFNAPLRPYSVATGNPAGVAMPPVSGAAALAGNLTNLNNGTPVPEGWLVLPHAGPSGLTAADVTQMIEQGVAAALQTRAAIRLPISVNAVMVIAVADPETGEILGLFRMPDSTIFSIDVAVSKARNVAYYDDPTQLQPIDQLPGIPAGVAFTNRTFRYLTEPFFPESVDGAPPGPFSILNDGHVNDVTGGTVGSPLPANAFKSVFGHDAFFPETNFRDPNNPDNQSGVVFFPGSSPLYKFGDVLVGGIGVSGDGVDQDDDVTNAAFQGFGAPVNQPTIDEFTFDGIRLPYQKFNRVPNLN